ncbi:hypothetical protein DJ546_24115, partial [Enterobacter hormaechei]
TQPATGETYPKSDLFNKAVFIQKLEHQKGKLADWVRELLCRKSNFVVTCALANKLARIAWALTTRQETFAS